MSSTPLSIQLLEQAISRAEGTAAGLGKGVAANNPGNLQDVYGNEIQYDTPQQGSDALTEYLQRAISGTNPNYSGPNETLQDFFDTYSGGSPNEANNISQITGAPLNTPMGAFNNFLSPGSSSAQAASSGAAPASTGILGSITGAISSAATTWANNPANPANYGTDIVRGVAILAGLVLIAGAVFGFQKMTTTIVTGAKKGLETAAVVGAAG